MNKIILGAIVLLTLCQCTPKKQLSSEVISEIAKEAYIYGYPVVENYRVMYHSTQDKDYPQYAPFNEFYYSRNVLTPKDTLFVSPNVDTPYSYAVLYIKDEPVVLTVPAHEKERFIGIPVYDLFTYVIYTISPKNMSEKGGHYMVAGTDWKGDVPEGIDHVIRCETELAYVLIRTQLFNMNDLPNVHKIQDGYKIQTLSQFTGKNPQTEAPEYLMPPLSPQSPTTQNETQFFDVLNFALKFVYPEPSENKLMKRFAEIGIVPGKKFEVPDSTFRKAVLDGMVAAQREMIEYLPKITSSAQIFGSRETLGDNYMGRAVGAWTGIYANSPEVFLGIAGVERQADGKPFSGENKYTLTFGKDDFPPVDAFWSITLYKLPSRSLYDNTINRYAINSPMINSLKRNMDGTTTIYIQHDSPGKEKESNWLPCPNGLFTMSFRCYMPKAELREGKWSSPPVLLSK